MCFCYLCHCRNHNSNHDDHWWLIRKNVKMDKAAAAFRAIDTDNSGFLDREEFLKFTRWKFTRWYSWKFIFIAGIILIFGITFLSVHHFIEAIVLCNIFFSFYLSFRTYLGAYNNYGQPTRKSAQYHLWVYNAEKYVWAVHNYIS